MLTVITMVSDDTPRNYVAECRDSVQRAADRAGFTVVPLETAGISGDIGSAMAAAVKRAKTPYLCWVDDDDFVLPNAFSCVASALRDKFDAVFAREVHLMVNGRFMFPDRRHHLTVVRTELAAEQPMAGNPKYTMMDLAKAASASRCTDEMSWVYVHRRRADSGGSRIRSAA